ncbi:TIGR00269 family protein [Geoglobus acetivorans]|uniref:TIGR00269 family protein n=1 Tax=Geoglobus acetivorans TaxID=565033 RepID=UPI00064F191F
MNCSYCNRRAVYFQRHSGKHLCRKHFVENFLKRVKRSIRKYRMIERNEIIAIALSGGKDSVVLSHVIKTLYGGRRDIELHAITVDEGIEDYRPPTVEISERLCRELDMEHHVVSFRDEVGLELDEIVKRGGRNACSYCGVFRKYLLNKKAREIGATKLATGHNLDDETQTILLNFLQSDIERMARLVPSRVQKGLVMRIKPLREIYEQEIVVYALLHNLPVSLEECPYSREPVRAVVRDFLYEFENRYPGRKFSVMRSFETLLPCLWEMYPQIDLNNCELCGEPTPKKICQACELKRELGLI